MKRFASHYLYISSYGFLKQYVVEINNYGHVVTLYPLKEEAESIIWTPGVISLIVSNQSLEGEREWKQKQIRTELPAEYNDIAKLKLTAVRLYPFDFNEMEPTEHTIFQVLDNNTF